jgi:hypothetical protein
VDEIALPKGFYDLEESFLPEGFYDRGRRAVSLFQLYPSICLTTEERNVSILMYVLISARGEVTTPAQTLKI